MNLENQEVKKVSPLNVIDGRSLLSLECEPPVFVVERLLPTGLSVLAGSPKVGKSWLSLWLCEKISRGEKVWEFETLRSTTLYLALEDTVDRLHFRLSHIAENSSSETYFTTEADSISSGLLEQLEIFVDDNPDTRLIVIDTLQKVRSDGKNRCGYSLDYEDMNKIKAFADRLKIAVLLIHHTRKTPDSDPFNTISGSTGLTGSADTMLILRKTSRTENTAALYVTGRDVEDMQINLEFDKEKKIWQFVSFGKECDNTADKIISALYSMLVQRKTFEGTMTELLKTLREYSDDITVTPNVLSRILNENENVLTERHITMTFARSNHARKVILTLDDSNIIKADFTVHSDSSDGDDCFYPPAIVYV